jgi:hypothetical protein
MNVSRALCLVALGLGVLAGCSTAPEANVAEATAAATTATTVSDLRSLIAEQRVMFDDVTAFGDQFEVIDSQRTEFLGIVNVDSLVRLPNGAVFNVHTVDGPVGTDPEGDDLFSDVRHFLVLDAAGLAHLAEHGRKTTVAGGRREQLVQVFNRAPHPSSPSELLWGENPFFSGPNGEGVAFIGAFYVRTNDGAISKYSLASDAVDPLDE